MLKQKGYATGGAVSAYVLRGETGIARGFDFFDDHDRRNAPISLSAEFSAAATRRRRIAQKWIGAHRRSRSSLLCTCSSRTRRTTRRSRSARRFKPYDAEIASRRRDRRDASSTRLKRVRLYDQALIVFLSDHGEGLGDHGEDEHGIFLYREAIQVPLMVKLPRARVARERAVGLRDVMPAILDDAAIALPAGWTARPLFAAKRRARRLQRDVLSALSLRLERPALAHRTGRNTTSRRRSPELYDLRADPARDAATSSPTDRRDYFAMKQAITPMMKRRRAAAPFDPEEAAKLAALGYIGSAGAAGSGGSAPRPKDKTADLSRPARRVLAFPRRKER